MPIQIYWKFYLQKWKFSDKKFWYVSYFCSKHRLWVLVMFLSRNKKNNVYLCKPKFYYIKMGFEGQNYIGMFSWCVQNIFSSFHIFKTTCICICFFPFQLYFTLVALTTFVIPALIIAICYTIILIVIWDKGRGFSNTFPGRSFRTRKYHLICV